MSVALFLVGFGLVTYVHAQGCSRPEGGPNMFLTGSDTFPVEQGAQATFKCNIGYSPEGTSGAVTCDKGTWSPLRMRCIRKNCGSAGEVANGVINYDGGTEFGDRITITCNTGYRLVGRNEITCGDQGWLDRLPTCEGKNCGSAGEVANGVINYDGGTEFGDKITITCNTGYRLVGRNEITCGDQGWLDRLPTCEVITAQGCPRPEGGPDMYLTGSNTFPVADGTTATFSCETGYKAQGDVTCNNGAWSSPRMRCTKKNCGSAGEVANGVINYNEGTEFGDRITITCNTGYRLVGRNEITCGDRGWLDRLPTCEVITAQGCSRPEGGPNMYLTGSNTFPVADGTTATFSCETGYKAQGDVTCNNGAWSSPRMRCTRKNCGSAGEVENGVINYNEGTEFGDRITITCNTGYRLFGRNKITCGDHGWLDRLPTCEAIV